jgi:hypothetical protein
LLLPINVFDFAEAFVDRLHTLISGSRREVRHQPSPPTWLHFSEERYLIFTTGYVVSGQQNYSSLRAHKVLYNEKVAARSSAYISDIQIMSVTTRHSGCSCNRKHKHGAVDDHRQSMAAKLCSSRTHTGKFCQRYTTHGTLN